MSGDNCFIIAEAGVNHNGKLERALELVDVAAVSGADAVKFQTFNSSQLVAKAAPKADYQIRQTGNDETQAQMLKALELSADQFDTIADRCRSKGIEFMSTPFDEPSVDLLIERLSVRTLKVSSGDLTNGPLLLKMARSQAAMIISTGMSTMEEIEEALGVIAFGRLGWREPKRTEFVRAWNSTEGRELLHQTVKVLHCTTEYPTSFDDVNLRAMDTMRERFGLPVGYSDHTVGITVPIAAVARGACVIEKHFTLDRDLPGPDHAASLEPDELRQMVVAIRETSRCLGHADKRPSASELKTAAVARRSLHALQPIKAGDTFDQHTIGPRRPGTGHSPMDYWDLLGKIASRDFATDERIE